MNDHELTVLVEAAASGAINSQAAHHGGDTWDQLHASIKNSIRESALPFIYHGTKALADLGYTKPRTISTREELDALPSGSVILDCNGEPNIIHDNGWVLPGGDGGYTSWAVAQSLPATVLHEPQP